MAQFVPQIAGPSIVTEPKTLGALLQPLVWLALLPHRWLYRLFRGLDTAVLDYFTAFHCMRILIWSYERQRADAGAPNPWSSQRARALVARRFARITGVELEMPADSIGAQRPR